MYRIVSPFVFYGNRELAAWRNLAADNVSNGGAAFLARIPRIEHSFHAFAPAVEIHAATGIENHRDMRVRLRQSGNH